MRIILITLFLFFSHGAWAHTSLVYSDIEKVQFQESKHKDSLTLTSADESAYKLIITCGDDIGLVKNSDTITIQTFYDKKLFGTMAKCKQKLKAIKKVIAQGKILDQIELHIFRKPPAQKKIFDISSSYRN